MWLSQQWAEPAPDTTPADSRTDRPSPTEPDQDEEWEDPYPGSLPRRSGSVGESELHLLRSGAGSVGTRGRPISSPTGAALPGNLALARALRPLRRRVPSRTHQVFDEEATVRRVAEEGIWLPVLRPARERWLAVNLVLDCGRSMGIWQATAAELRCLFDWLGAFRSVRLWHLDSERQPPCLRTPSPGRTAPRDHNADELFDPAGPSVIVVVSDCVGPAWHDGGMTNLLATWTNRAPVAILQVLPEHLWSRTALAAAMPVRLAASAAAIANARLLAEPLHDWVETGCPGGAVVPVASLEPGPLAAWARLVTGAGAGWMPGVCFETTSAPPADLPDAEEEMDPEERLRQFWRVSSLLARRLAGLLAAAPVLNLPLIRLVREALLPAARQGHEAEVLLGGLLRELPGPPGPAASSEEVFYDFHDGVRPLLLDGVPADEALTVLQQVSAWVEEHLGGVRGFRALLADPAAAPGRLAADQGPFARVAAEVLERLGGDYARLSAANLPPDDTEPSEIEWAVIPEEASPSALSPAAQAPRPVQAPGAPGRRETGVLRGWLNRWFGGQRKTYADHCPRCLSRGTLEVRSSPAEDQHYPEPRYVLCTECGYEFRAAYLRLPRLCFPTIGASSSGKTHWLVTIYDLIRRAHLPVPVSIQRAPSLADEQFDRLVQAVIEHRHAPAATVHTGLNAPLMFHVRDNGRWRTKEAMLNLFDFSGEVMDQHINVDLLRHRALLMDGFVLFLDPTQVHGGGSDLSIRDQINQLGRFYEELCDIRGLAVGQKVPTPVAVCISKLDLLKTKNPMAGQAIPWLRTLRETMGRPVDLALLHTRSRLCEEQLHLIFPSWDVPRTLREKFGNRFLFFPLTPVGLEESELGVTDLARRTIVPFGVLEPVLWLLQMHGYRVLS